jgi:GNAT superfamily N-acetyltransferase
MDTQSPFKVRVARPEELQIIQELNSGAFENDAEHDPHLVMNWPHDPSTGGAYFKNRLDGDGIIFVAEDANGVVGYLAGAMHSNESYRRGSRSELENMFVRPNARRSGIGSALMDAFVDWSRDHGADEVYVSAYFDNTRAVEFYKHSGFRSYSHDLLLDLRAES